ncbi:MAG: hypothetical protein WC497_00260 [Patescibacteria group bacterium]
MKGFRILIIVLGGLAVLAAAALVVLRLTQKPTTANTNTNIPANNAVVNTTNENTNASNLNANANTNIVNTNTVPSNTNTNTGSTPEANLKAVARSFAERFGTYSNHSDFENIEHLIPYMSERMKKWAQKYLDEQRDKTVDQSVYYGMITRTMSVKQISYDSDNGTAEFLVTTQRNESTGTSSNARIFYQDLQIKFIKEQSVWKVNEAWWQ